MSIAGISFAHSDSGKEFSGMMSFGPRNFTLYMVDASTYNLKSRQDDIDKSTGIEIAKQDWRMTISIRKQVFGNGWTTVFGK
jgi:hypothetical protein